tara:strand:- start:21746 stop:22231 length:486 start_codon:yes stop_codon:yes gene_type:complete
MIKLRATLESNEDVIRELIIDENLTLEELHRLITKNFNLNDFEMASFFQTDSDLNLGREITLYDTSEKGGESLVMNEVIISTLLYSSETQLIYVYDFLKMWRFYIQYVEKVVSIESTNLYSKGKMPSEAPKFNFESEENIGEFDPFEEELEDFDKFEDYEY